MITATKRSAFITGIFSAAAALLGTQLKIEDFPDNFIGSFLLLSSIAMIFFFVVRDDEYEFKIWYGLDDLKISDLSRIFAWLLGAALTLLIAEIF